MHGYINISTPPVYETVTGLHHVSNLINTFILHCTGQWVTMNLYDEQWLYHLLSQYSP